MKVTDAIALEHAILLRVFDEVERVLPRLRSAAEVRTLATIVEGVLETHAELEINFAFVALDHTLYHKRRLTTLHHDHRELKDQFRRVHNAPTCQEARRRLRAGMGAARAHFGNEERGLFPNVERTLGLPALTALGEGFKKAAKAKAKGRSKRG